MTIPEYPMVDTHHHFWDRSRFRLPWIEGVPALARSFLMDDYLQAVEGLGVVKSIYMEVSVDQSQRVEEADYVLDICRSGRTLMVAAVIAGDPARAGFRDYIGRFRSEPLLKGVRGGLQVPDTPDGYRPRSEFVEGVRLLGELDLSLDLCIRAEDLSAAAVLADACPDTRFILNHCGNANVQSDDLSGWRSGISEVARRHNVICKVSGIVATAKPGSWQPSDLEPIVKHAIAEFGWDRVVFGGDWPVCTLAASYRQWVEALRWILRDASPADQRKLFHDNAVAFYGLE